MKQRLTQQKISRPDARTRASSVGASGQSITPPNRTGLPRRLQAAGIARGPHEAARLPDALKSGVEALSGMALDDVRVDYNSPKPAGLQALAYTQGTEIHVGPAQERHLPHEAWHVVQQKQGRVKPLTEASSNTHDAGCACNNCSGKSAATNIPPIAGGTVQRKISLDGNLSDVDTTLKVALKQNNRIPGTINELKTALGAMISDETDRTTSEKVAEDLQTKMAAIYNQAKNVANLKLRMEFPDQAFLDTSSENDLKAFLDDEILGKDADYELGYLIDPATNMALGAGLGQARYVDPHDITADETAPKEWDPNKWKGKVMHHSHPSGSPPTIPSDILVAVKRQASGTIVHTRNFTFGLKMDYTKKGKGNMNYYATNKYLGEGDLVLHLAASERKGKWAEEAQKQGLDNWVYNQNSNMNAQEKRIIEEEMSKKFPSNPEKWTMDLDYGMNKFVGYKEVEKDFAPKGLTVTSTASMPAYLAYRKGFYEERDT